MFSAPKKGLKKDRGLLVFEDWSSGGISLPKKLYGWAASPCLNTKANYEKVYGSLLKVEKSGYKIFM